MKQIFAIVTVLVVLSACGSSKPADTTGTPGFINGKATHPTVKLGKPYTIRGETYTPHFDPDYSETGEASWYGPGFHGRKTANGETFDKYDMTAAHRTLPLPSMVRVTNLSNGKTAIVRVNDRGPFAHGRIIDLSKSAAQEVDMLGTGVAEVKVEYLKEETEAYIAQIGGKKSESRLAWEQKNLTPSESVHVADVNARGDVNKTGGGWFDAIIPTAHADPRPALSNTTHKAASLDGISSADLAPPTGMNATVQNTQMTQKELPPARLPEPNSGSNITVASAAPVTPSTPVNQSYRSSPYDVLKSEKMPSQNVTSIPVAPKTIPVPTKITAPIPQAQAPPPIEKAQAPPIDDGLFIQVGAFSSKENALKIEKQYSAISNTLIQGVPEDNPNIYRVRLGPFKDRYSAENVLSQVRSQGAPDAQLLAH